MVERLRVSNGSGHHQVFVIQRT